MTVDWSKWMTLTPAGQDALWRRYRQIVAQEVAQLKARPAKLNAILSGKRRDEL